MTKTYEVEKKIKEFAAEDLGHNPDNFIPCEDIIFINEASRGFGETGKLNEYPSDPDEVVTYYRDQEESLFNWETKESIKVFFEWEIKSFYRFPENFEAEYEFGSDGWYDNYGDFLQHELKLHSIQKRY